MHPSRPASVVLLLLLSACNGIAGIGAPTLDPCFDGSCGGGGGGAPGEGGAGGGPTSVTGVMTPACGNGHIEPGETCDDGNTTDGDGCAHDCQVECSAPGTFLEPTTHHCYFAGSEHPGASWDGAQGFCASFGFALASITSQQELDFVMPHAMGPTWLGGTRVGGAYVWSDGEPWSFAPWKSGAPPDDDHKACVKLDAGKFDVDDCNGKHAFLCERAPAGS